VKKKTLTASFSIDTELWLMASSEVGFVGEDVEAEVDVIIDMDAS
jgi:hypothetical protein